jgi:hypothetical protein
MSKWHDVFWQTPVADADVSGDNPEGRQQQ